SPDHLRGRVVDAGRAPDRATIAARVSRLCAGVAGLPEDLARSGVSSRGIATSMASAWLLWRTCGRLLRSETRAGSHIHRLVHRRACAAVLLLKCDALE